MTQQDTLAAALLFHDAAGRVITPGCRIKYGRGQSKIAEVREMGLKFTRWGVFKFLKVRQEKRWASPVRLTRLDRVAVIT